MIRPRKVVQELTAYAAPDENRSGRIRLDFNENTTGFPEFISLYASDVITVYPEYQAFLQKLADYFELPAEMIFLTNGSDEALAVIPATFIEPGVDAAVISDPTFSMIPHYLKLAGANIYPVSVTDALEFNLSEMTAILKQGIKLAIFPSPDNPTGASLSIDQVSAWCQEFSETLFVIDEAYAEYAGETVLPLVHQYKNLLVTRTFSKAWGLAGLRLGVVMGSPELIEYMGRVRSPYSVNAMAVHAAESLLKNSDSILKEAQNVMLRKSKMIEQLIQRGFQVHAGHANFFLLYLGIEASVFTTFCEMHGLLVRDRSTVSQLSGMVRISVGTEAEMDHFLKTVEMFAQQHTLIFDLDDTLVDCSKSYDATVMSLVEKYTGNALSVSELHALRAEGGFNDDWDATVALLQRRGHALSRDEIETHGKALYLETAKAMEKLWIEHEMLDHLKTKFRLLIVTGRPRDEFEPVWHAELSPWFERVVCQDDYPNCRRKPAPDSLKAMMAELGLTGGIYVGNSVDDMRAATAAGLIPVGIATTHSADVLYDAGARIVLESIHQLERILR